MSVVFIFSRFSADSITSPIGAFPLPLFFPYSTSVLFYIKPGKRMQRKNHPKKTQLKEFAPVALM